MNGKIFSCRLMYLQFLLIIISFTISGCGGGGRTQEDDLIDLKIGFIPIAECLELYVADEQGFFLENGLKVSLQPMTGGAKITNYIASGELDVGFTNVVSLVYQNTRGVNLTPLYGGSYETPSNQNHRLVYSADWYNKHEGNLWGNVTVAVNTKNNIEHLMLLKYLKIKNISPDDVALVELGFPIMLSQLERNEINIASLVEPFITIANNSMSESVVLGDNQYLVDSKKVLVATYVGNRDRLDKNSTAARRFASAMKEAREYIRMSEDSARKILPKYTKISTEMSGKINLPVFEEEMNGSDLQVVIELMKEFEFISPELNSADLATKIIQ